MADNNSEHKPLKPTPHKLREARKHGQVATSREFIASISLLAVMLLFLIGNKWFFGKFRDIFDIAAQNAPLKLEAINSGPTFKIYFIISMMVIVISVVATTTAVMASMVITGGPVFSLKPISPQFSRLNPMEGFKRIFSMRHWVTFVRGVVVVIILIAGALIFGAISLSPAMWVASCGASCAAKISSFTLNGYVIFAVLVLIAFAIIDLPIQFLLFKDEQKMSHSELKREQREQYGSPEMRRARKEIRHEMANIQRIDKNNANFFIAGENYMVGVKYEKETTPSPVVVSKLSGDDFIVANQEIKSQGKIIIQDSAFAEKLMRYAPNGYPVPSALFAEIAHIMVKNKIV